MLLIDAIVLKICDGQVRNRPVYVAMGISVGGERDVLGLWAGPAGREGAKQWMPCSPTCATAVSLTAALSAATVRMIECRSGLWPDPCCD